MYSCYNNEIIKASLFLLDANNRSFQYGDGLFETIIVHKGTIRLFKYHLDRLMRGLATLQIEHNFNSTIIKEQILSLIRKNKLESARVKLQVWRANGGLYGPKNNSAEILLTCSFYSPSLKTIEHASFAESIYNTKTPLSNYKTCNSLPYILAALERDKRSLSELILLNNEGFVSECVSSNIFWIKNDTYYTPSLSTGCVEGVMRKHIIFTANKNQILLHTGNYTKAELLEADSVFISNATGIYPIISIDNVKFDSCDLGIYKL